MNFTLISEEGQDALGYVELYANAEPSGKKTVVSVYYMPEGFNEHPNARVSVTIVTEIDSRSFSKSDLHEIMGEITSYVRENSHKYFKRPEVLSYMDTVTLHVGNVDGIEEITHGDYAIF